ncbi:MAG: diacylglycerol kinase family lipid kinase [Coriobacteriales bacterium]|jgi:YegS/Rv2252/BmrU family lipid kinase|nr:diacylglycerol kinase family lipid kinase [Coriobacteriales bacterium]
MNSIENILVLVNPIAASNSGSRLWGGVRPRFEALFSDCTRRVIETTSREHSIELGETAKADLIIAVGGDGSVHSIAQGIMHRPRDERPTLGVLPIGSGNDFARSLGISFAPKRALAQLSDGVTASVDVGRCNDIFFLETLSIGVDAAVAIKTVELRKSARDRGLLLYARAAISAILHELRAHHFSITTKEGLVLDEELLICAIQNGQTYGGGFRITPEARLNDGQLDICVVNQTSTLFALYALALLSRGKHEHLSIVRSFKTKALHIEIADEIAIQCDGEAVQGKSFDIELLPDALEVLMPRDATL